VTIRAVLFDVGETLVDETRIWSAWADWLGVPRLTLQAVLGAVIERGGDHREVFEILHPGIDLRAAVADRLAAGELVDPAVDDLYPDALDCLHRLGDAGYRLAIAGNQPDRLDAMLSSLGVRIELVASSASLGVEKPDPRFFRAIAERLDLPPAAIAAVGDRVDNDVRPAAVAGMEAIFLRRGPWAWIQAGRDEPPEADVVIDSLAELPEALTRLG
jgi:FMN phosphatase YigB (HAD superfamily)